MVVVENPQDFGVSPWHFDIGVASKIDDVLADGGGLLHALPLAVHLKFLDNSYCLNFFVGPLLHA